MRTAQLLLGTFISMAIWAVQVRVTSVCLLVVDDRSPHSRQKFRVWPKKKRNCERS